jgi:probable HAF family extracellular repeat protein
MRRIRSAGVAITVALLAVACLGAPAIAAGPAASDKHSHRYRVVDLGVIVGEHSLAYAVNDHGEVVGNYVENSTYQAFAWRQGVVTRLGSPGVSSIAMDINNRGQVVGASGTHAALWEHGVLTDLGTLGESTSVAVAINDHGQVVGNTRTATGESHAVLWEHGRITDLGPGEANDIDNHGVIVGRGESRACRWIGHRRIDFGSEDSRAQAINERGQIVGGSQVAGEPGHAVLWRHGSMTDLGMLPGAIFSYANDLNDRGQIVGNSTLPDGTAPPVMWSNGRMIDLTTVGLPQYSMAIGINNRGDIAGMFYVPNGFHAALFR